MILFCREQFHARNNELRAWTNLRSKHAFFTFCPPIAILAAVLNVAFQVGLVIFNWGKLKAKCTDPLGKWISKCLFCFGISGVFERRKNQASLQRKNSSNQCCHKFAVNQVKIALMHYLILTTNNAGNVWKSVGRIVSKLGTKC